MSDRSRTWGLAALAAVLIAVAVWFGLPPKEEPFAMMYGQSQSFGFYCDWKCEAGRSFNRARGYLADSALSGEYAGSSVLHFSQPKPHEHVSRASHVEDRRSVTTVWDETRAGDCFEPDDPSEWVGNPAVTWFVDELCADFDGFGVGVGTIRCDEALPQVINGSVLLQTSTQYLGGPE